ncbi:MAG: flavodoxin family protein [Draconibacterium sp.]|nr:flavodoxin family protein [Draconibacterium sp.]
MKKIVAFNGSARKNGNTQFLLNSFLEGAEKSGADFDKIDAHEINLDYCNGCLRCNLIKRCSIRGDEWNDLSLKILESDVLVFATPIYFHHVSGQLKKIIDRFRSFVHVQITESGLKHTPHVEWDKDFVLLLSLGSSSNEDAQPVIELFKYMVEILGSKNRLHVITATRLGVTKQVIKTEDELVALYPKLGLSQNLVEGDFQKNQQILTEGFKLGEKI